MFIQLLSAQDFELLVYLLDRTYQEIKLLRHQHRFDDFISTVLSIMDRAAPAIERRPGRKKILRVSNKRCPNSDPGLFYEVWLDLYLRFELNERGICRNIKHNTKAFFFL